MLSFLTLLLLLLLLLLAQPSCLLAISQHPPKNIFILAGQSNMAGRGGVLNDTKTGISKWDRVVPPQCQPNPSIFRLSANLTWVLATEPLHKDIDYNKTNGIGPGMAFSNAILTEEPGFGTVGLVPCAIGGTSIRQWAKGGFLYDQLVRRTTAAVQGGGTIRAMLWYQGESDTEYKEDADNYKQNLQNFFNNVRQDLNYPTLPIFQVALASGLGPYIETVRKAQFETANELGKVKCVDAKGLPLDPDRLHLTTPSQVALGQSLATAFLNKSQSSVIRTASKASRIFSGFIGQFFIWPLLTSALFICCKFV